MIPATNPLGPFLVQEDRTYDGAWMNARQSNNFIDLRLPNDLNYYNDEFCPVLTIASRVTG